MILLLKIYGHKCRKVRKIFKLHAFRDLTILHNLEHSKKATYI